ncbi:MAG: element excision factor XisI family protein [Bacteroidota bacterium]
MDKVTRYKNIIREILYSIADRKRTNFPEVKTFVIEDQEKGHFLLFKDGWKDDVHRFYGCPLHLGVNEDGKVYLYYDMTEDEIGQQLLDKGVTREDLVPAFQPPSMRMEMGFAVS